MTSTTDYSARRFMIVDDQPFMQDLIERTLRQLKTGSVTKARDGREALGMIRDNLTQTDCIIADFNMKPMNGIQLLQAVRMGVNPRIPRDQAFIMLTGNGQTEVVKTAVMLDVSGYLIKPVSAEKMRAAIDRALEITIRIKDPDYYAAVKLNNVAHMNDAASSAPKAWVILSKSSKHRESVELQAKIAHFRVENATRDGVEEVQLKNKRRCDLGEIREGMTLAEDIEAEEGVILVRRGTHLTSRMIDRLRELAVESDTRAFVWIGDLAK